ncbi:MAG: PAS domain-containing protein [Fibrobacter sp.]|nr:PAS domain-containing protein [Fibrobacter sp.]
MIDSGLSREDSLTVLRSALEHVHEGVYCVDNDRRIFFWNAAATKITGYTAEEMIGKRCFETSIKHIDHKGNNLCAAMCPLVATMFDGRIRTEPVYAHCKDGRLVEVVVNAYPLLIGDQTIGAIEIFTQKAVVDAHQTFLRNDKQQKSDESGLPNSDYVNYFIDVKIQEKRHFDSPFVFQMIRLDNFDEIAEDRGDDVAEGLVRQMAELLRSEMRSSELLGRLKKNILVGVYMSAAECDVPVIQRHTDYVIRKLMEDENLKISVAGSSATAEDTPSKLIGRVNELLDKSALG